MLLLGPAQAAAPGTVRVGTEGGPGVPVIPEPLVFDMIRPLGARKGELEANVLAVGKLGGEPVEWAPEAEYALANGLAFELELPFDGAAIQSLKLGAQYTFGVRARGRYVDGVQYLGFAHRDGGWSSTLLYLAGIRYDARWSSMTMVGLTNNGGDRPARAAPVVNHSVFRDVGSRTTAGLEFNYAGGPGGTVLLMPQLHQRIARHAVAQVGAGMKQPHGRARGAAVAVRLVGEF